ncbi:hypothetical protein [Terrabacter sp. BE26]|uniref:hypothetical protein n=1 Tax=Terrabacter sp. BE26 TaxID=2898152 RepID=UPI0035BE4933
MQRFPIHAPGATHAGDRATARKVYAFDGDEHPLTLDLPGPRRLADRWLLPTLADGGSRLCRVPGGLRLQSGDAEPVNVAARALAEALLVRLRTLPAPTPSDSETYVSLWTLGARVREPAALGYLGDVVAAARTRARRWEPPRVKREPVPPAELRRRSRATAKHRETETARAWLAVWLTDDDEPPATIATTELLSEYVSSPLVAEWLEAAEEAPDEWLDGEHEEHGGPDVLPRVGGPRSFYAVATDVLGDRRRAPGGRAWLYSTTDARRRALGLSDEETHETLADLVAGLDLPAPSVARRTA